MVLIAKHEEKEAIMVGNSKVEPTKTVKLLVMMTTKSAKQA
jgi:hypothetical protein